MNTVRCPLGPTNGALLARQTYTSAGALGKTALYSYDGEGNQTGALHRVGTSSSQTNYVYDGENQLVKMETPGVSKMEFVYDGLSRLRITRSYKWAVATSTTAARWVEEVDKRRLRVYDGMDLVQERDANNVVTASVTRAGNIGDSYLI